MIADRTSTMAAALAYYTFFSIAPVVIIAVAVAGVVFGPDTARGEISLQLNGLIGVDGAQAVEALVKGASGPRSGVVATLIGLVAILFGATGVFAELQDALNVIWKAPPLKINTVVAFFRTRFLSFTVVLGIGFLLLVSLMASVAVSALCSWAGQWTEWIGQSLTSVLSLAITTGLFALIFKLLPDAKVAWRDVWLGAVLTAGLFTLGKYVLGLVLGQATVLSTYGAAASLAAFLLWVYYSSMILLLGAELSHAIATRARRHGQPAAARPGVLIPGAAPAR